MGILSHLRTLVAGALFCFDLSFPLIISVCPKWSRLCSVYLVLCFHQNYYSILCVVSIFSACMSALLVCLVSVGVQKRVSGPLEVELQTVVTSHTGVTCVL